MREILFRGKRYSQSEKDGDWIVGYYTGLDNGVHYIKSNTAEYYAVHGETLGQYTGLNDKNGRKIFEGDIISCYDRYESRGKQIAEVVYNADLSARYFVTLARYSDCELHLCKDKEIIGNIYDNPDLLEVE